MTRPGFTAAAVFAFLAAGSTLAAAQDRDRTQSKDTDRTQAQDRDPIRDQDIYGSQLMTPEERNEHRARMRTARTEEERERIRAENHERMKQRAEERGITLAEVPPERGGGMGPGGGINRPGGDIDRPGSGMMGPGGGVDRPGGGMGPGRGR